MIHTWSVGRRLKSFGGFVITYLLPGASGPALLSRNLDRKGFAPCFMFLLFLLLMFRRFRFLHIIKLHFCLANYIVIKSDTLDMVHQKFLPVISKEICATLLKMKIFFVDWTFSNNFIFHNKISILSIWSYCANMQRAVFLRIADLDTSSIC